MFKSKFKVIFIKFINSNWVFPSIATLFLIILTCLNLNGSSIGAYHDFFYETEDKNLLLNSPRMIRGDEWVVATPMALAQFNSNFPTVNTSLGDGQSMNVILDVPSLNIWQIFKPHNIAFYIMPFDHAFAFKWWFMGYLLLLSVYFFVLRFLPKKRLLASLLAISVLLSPFVQWWYQYITVAPIFYILFIYLTATKIYSSKSRTALVAYTALLAYLIVCFALVQYPAFQIAVILAIVPIFIADLGKKILTKRTFLPLAGVIASCLIILGFLVTIKPELQAISNSSYPGQRSITSGGYNPLHMLASGFSPLFQSDSRAQHYSIPKSGAFNQSESSNFILLLPYLMPALLLIAIKGRRHGVKLHTRRIAITVFCVSVVALVWMLVPHLDIFGKLLLLDKVPHARLMILFGILNLMSIVVIIKSWEKMRIKVNQKVVYLILTTLVSLAVGYYVHSRFPEFAGPLLSVFASLVVPSIAGLYIFNKHLTATVLLCLFSVVSTALIHPLYRGTTVLSDNELVNTIVSVNKSSPGVWALEDTTLENMAISSGAKSISGVFTYPQIEYWRNLAPSGTDESIYNRYAHVTYNFDRSEDSIDTVMSLQSSDNIVIKTEPCSDFTTRADLSYIVTSTPITGSSGRCLQKIRELNLTSGSLLIYKIDENKAQKDLTP